MRTPNLILAGMYPDPSACQVGEVTYVVTSTFTWLPGLPIHATTDGEHWELCGHALVESGALHLDQAAESQGIFAPTLRYIGGRFVLVCTTVVGDTQRSFVMTAARPEGPWSPPVFLEEAGGIDPDVFEDEDGTVWWTGTRLAADPLWEQQTEIWTRPVDLNAGVFTGQEHVIWHGAVQGAVWAEAPHLYKRGQWYYLLTAEGGTAEEHSVSVARARHVTGPWQGCPRNPIFTHRNFSRSGEEIHNVGHADLFQRPDGSWWAVLLGVRLRGNRHLLGRETFLCPVAWENDWPIFAPDTGRLLCTRAESRDPVSIAFAEFLPQCLRPVGAMWDEAERDFRGVRMNAWHAGIAMDAAALSTGDSVRAFGIVQDAHNWARLIRSDDGYALELCRSGEVERLPLAEPPPATQTAPPIESAAPGQTAAPSRAWIALDDLVLRAGIGERDNAGYAYSTDAQWLSTEVAGGFTGCLLGVWTTADTHANSQLCLHGADLHTTPQY